MEIRTYGKRQVRKVDPNLYHKVSTESPVVNAFDKLLKETGPRSLPGPSDPPKTDDCDNATYSDEDTESPSFSGIFHHPDQENISLASDSESDMETTVVPASMHHERKKKGSKHVTAELDVESLGLSSLTLSPIPKMSDSSRDLSASCYDTAIASLDNQSSLRLDNLSKTLTGRGGYSSQRAARPSRTGSSSVSSDYRSAYTAKSAMSSMQLKPSLTVILSRAEQPEEKQLSLQGSMELLCESFSVEVPLGFAMTANGELTLEDEEANILALCKQDNCIPFSSAFPRSVLSSCEKIGEGTYGEVFQYLVDGEENVMKIVPVQGSIRVNGAYQKTFKDIFPELLVTKELSDLRKQSRNSTPNFILLKRIMYVRGEYPQELCIKWDHFALHQHSDNDSPEIFGPSQRFLIFIFANGGTDLEKFKVSTFSKAMSIFKQVAISLAVAEEALEFEHRDLHWGNILVKPCDKAAVIDYRLDSEEISVKAEGVFVSVIDYSLSRLKKDNCCLYYDMQDQVSIFKGPEELQFEIYRMMKEKNRNTWSEYTPETNVMWLNYLLEKLLRDCGIQNASKKGKQAEYWLKCWKKEILRFASATEFVLKRVTNS